MIAAAIENNIDALESIAGELRAMSEPIDDSRNLSLGHKFVLRNAS